MPDFVDATSSELERKARALQWMCWTEAITYSALFLFWVSGNAVGTAVMGSIHGLTVLAFAAMLIMITPAMRWSWWFDAAVLLTGPIGAIVVYERLRRHGVPEEYRIATRTDRAPTQA